MYPPPPAKRGGRLWLIVLAAVVLAAGAGGYVFLNHNVGTPLPNSALASPTPIATQTEATTAGGRPPLAQFTDDTSMTQVTIPIKDTPSATNAPFNFTPRYIIISVGATVTWNNVSDAPHNVIATNKDAFPNSPILVSQGTNKYTYTFIKAGDYPYYCGIHPAMTGWIIVR